MISKDKAVKISSKGILTRLDNNNRKAVKKILKIYNRRIINTSKSGLRAMSESILLDDSSCSIIKNDFKLTCDAIHKIVKVLQNNGYSVSMSQPFDSGEQFFKPTRIILTIVW